MKHWKYILGILLIIVPCTLTVLIYNDKITQNSPVYFKQGVNLYNNGDYQNAYYNFGKIKWISPLYPMALFKQAKSAQNVGDYKTAALKYNMFLKKMPHSIFELNAKINLGKCYYYSKQYDLAKQQFEELHQKTDNNGTEEVFFLGLIEKNINKTKAAEYFREYLNCAIEGQALNDNFILAAAEELSNLGVELNNEDYKLIGIAYYKNNRYKNALRYFAKLPVEQCWDYLVLSNHYAGNKVIAKKLIINGLKTNSHIISEDNLYKIYDIYTSYLTGSKLRNWQTTLKMVKDNSLKGEDYVLFMIAEILPKDKALPLYTEIVQKYPESKFAPESLWNVFWSKYKKKDYKNAELIAIQHLKTYKKVKSTPKMGFWLAKTEQKLNKQSEAHNYFSKLASKYPDDYYGLRAQNIVDKKDDFWNTSPGSKMPQLKEEIQFPISISQLDIKDLKLINTLFDMGDYEVWLDADFSNDIVASWFELKKGKKSRSIVLARNAIEKMDIKPLFHSASYQLAYPRHFVDEINIAGQKLNIDPFLVMAIIREESYFNESAKSRTNARGLMQLMPATANYMVSRLSVDMNNLADMENPRMNLYLGCNYIKYLHNKFNNDLLVVAAYNGGEGSVNKWLKTYNTSDYDEFIEDIPFDETRNYVKKVFRSYHLYKTIYK